MKFGGAAWVGLGAVVLILFIPVNFMQPWPNTTTPINPSDVKFGNRDWWVDGTGEKFPLWRFQQPLFFCAAVPFKVTRRCGKSYNANGNCSVSGDSGWEDRLDCGTTFKVEDTHRLQSSGLVTPLSDEIGDQDYWAVRWNVRGRPDGTNSKSRITHVPGGELTGPYFSNMREWTKARKMFWRVHVTGISHRGRVLRGWYHLRVRLDWESPSKYYVIDRLMISARGRTHSKTKSGEIKRTWHGGIGEFVYDFPACQCKGLTYPDYHDGKPWTARCNEWNPCSYDRYPDEYHNSGSGDYSYTRKSGTNTKCYNTDLFTPPCGTVPSFESNYGNNFMYRRARFPPWRGNDYNGGDGKQNDWDYGPEQMDEIHVNFKLDQSFCNMYHDLDFVVDGVVIDARNLAGEVVPSYSSPAPTKERGNIDLYIKHAGTRDWNYGIAIRANGSFNSSCFDEPACVFAVERTISTRLVFTTEEIKARDTNATVPATPPSFYESADPLPTLDSSEELNCNVALNGIYKEKDGKVRPISGENFYGAIKYVYSSEGPVDEVWDKRGHTLSYYDAQIDYIGGSLYVDEIKEVDPTDNSIYFDQTLAGEYKGRYTLTGGWRSSLTDYSLFAKCGPGADYSPVTGRYDPVVSTYWGKKECGRGEAYRTPPTCDFLFTDRREKITDVSHQVALRYLNTRTGNLPEKKDFPEDVYQKPPARDGYQTVYWYKHFNPKRRKIISRKCQIKKIMKKSKCPGILARPWTPKPEDKVRVTQRIRNRVQSQREWFNTTDRLERGMLINGPGSWFAYDSRVMHGVHMSVLTFFFMPVSAFMARFYKETFMETRIFTHHVWYWAHLVLVWMSGASYLVGLWRQRESRFIVGVNMGIVASIHRLIGWNSTIVMIFMILFGGIRCIDKTYRKFAAYFHAICAHTLHYSNLFCVVLSIYIPGSPSACFDRSWYLMEREHWYYFFFEPVVECVMVWCVFDIVMHAIMSHFQRKTDAMLELDKFLPKPRYLCPVMFPVLDENFAYDVPLRMKRIICLGIYIAGAGTMATITWIVIHATSSQNRGLGYMSCTHDTGGKILMFGTKPPPYFTKFPENCESPWVTPLI